MTPTELSVLIQKLAAGTASPDELAALRQWYDTVHTQTTVEWPAESAAESEALPARMLASLESKLKAADPQTDVRIVLPRIHYIPLVQRTWFRVAAAVVLFAGIGLLTRPLWSGRGTEIAVANTSDEIRQITLPDHSQVWLNAASTLHYAEDFTAHREIRLEGEAYFDVIDDKAHPFVVNAGELRTTVLGTRFDVRSFAADQQHDITVISGKVQVDEEGKVLDVLGPARQLQYDRQDRHHQTLDVDTMAVMAWRQDTLRFNNQNMEQIANVLGRKFKVRFAFRDDAIRNCRLIGQFAGNQSLSSIMDAMTMVLGFKYIIDEKQKTVTLYGKGCAPEIK